MSRVTSPDKEIDGSEGGDFWARRGLFYINKSVAWDLF